MWLESKLLTTELHLSIFFLILLPEFLHPSRSLPIFHYHSVYHSMQRKHPVCPSHRGENPFILFYQHRLLLLGLFPTCSYTGFQNTYHRPLQAFQNIYFMSDLTANCSCTSLIYKTTCSDT
uniref:Uncharacterized protein n=1 Tax=Octopus bimaculoides TaxID=37653 RepID=A0A0L8I5L4_OCTBM